jgi:hypothetical protein
MRSPTSLLLMILNDKKRSQDHIVMAECPIGKPHAGLTQGVLDIQLEAICMIRLRNQTAHRMGCTAGSFCGCASTSYRRSVVRLVPFGVHDRGVNTVAGDM